MLDSRCILTVFIQLNYVENNGQYLDQLGNKAAYGVSFASIEHPESSITNVQPSCNPAPHKDWPRLFED